MQYSVFSQRPADFSPSAEASGCYIEWDGKVLFLRRCPHKYQGSFWGVPAGKLERQETPIEAVIREVREEIALDIDNGTLENIGILYVRLPHQDYLFHMFRSVFIDEPSIELHLEENEEARFVTYAEAIRLPLMVGAKEGLDHYQSWICKKTAK